MNEMNQLFNNTTNDFLGYFTQYKVVKIALFISIILYGHLAAPLFPKKFLWIFDNPLFKIFFLSFIAWTSHHDPLLGIATSIVFLLVVDLINKVNLEESFEGPSNAIYPGCMNITVSDLLESFKGEKEQLLNAMVISRVPYDVKIDDLNAPIIATYLLNHGFALKSPCAFPTREENIGY